MSKKALELELIPIHKLVEADALLKEHAELTAEVEADDTVTTLQQSHLREDFNKRQGKNLGRILVIEKSLEQYAKDNKAAWFTEKKTLELNYGSFGFRQSTFVDTLSKWTMKKALEALKAVKWGKDYIRQKDEIDKEAILSGKPPGLSEVGLRIKTEDHFFIEPRKDPTANPNSLRGDK